MIVLENTYSLFLYYIQRYRSISYLSIYIQNYNIYASLSMWKLDNMDQQMYRFQFEVKHCQIDGIKFPCRYFIEVKTGNNKNVLKRSVNTVEIVNGLATFDQAITFDVRIVRAEGKARYLIGDDIVTRKKCVQTIESKKQKNENPPVQVLILLNLTSVRRPDQIKLVGRYVFDLQALLNDSTLSTRQISVKLQYSSVQAFITFIPKLISSQICPFNPADIQKQDISGIQELLLGLNSDNSSQEKKMTMNHGQSSNKKQSQEPNDNIPNIQSKHNSRIQQNSHIWNSNQLNKNHDQELQDPKGVKHQRSPSKHSLNKSIEPEMQRQRSLWDQEKSQLHQQINIEKQQKTRIKENLETIQKQLTSLNTQHSLELQEKQEQIQKLVSALHEANQQKEIYLEEINRMKFEKEKRIERESTSSKQEAKKSQQMITKLNKQVEFYTQMQIKDQEQIEKLLVQMEKYQDQIQENKSYIRGLQEAILQAHEEKTEMETKIHQSTSHFDALEDRLKQAKQYQHNLQKDILDRDHQKNQLHSLITKLNNQLDQLQRQPPNKDYVQGLEQKIIQDYQKISQMEQQVNSLKSVKIQLQNQFQLLRHTHQMKQEELNETIQSLKKQVKSDKGDIVLKSKILELQAQVFEKQEQIMKLTASLGVGTHDEDLLILQNKLIQKEQFILNLENALSEKKLRVQQLELITKSSDRENHKSMELEQEDKLKNHDQAILRNLPNLERNNESEFDSPNQKVNKLESTIIQLREQIKGLRQEMLVSQKQRVNILKQKQQEFAQNLMIIQEESNNVVTELKEKELIIAQANHKTQLLKQTKQKQISQINQNINKLQAQFNIVHQQLQTVKRSKEQQEKNIEKNNNQNFNQIMELNARIEELEEEMFAYQSEDKFKDILIADQQSEINAITTANHQLYLEIESLKFEKQQADQELAFEDKLLANESIALKQKINQQAHQLNLNQAQIQELQAINKEYQTKLIEKDEILIAKDNQLTALKSLAVTERVKYKDLFDQNSQRISNIQELEKALESFQNKYDDLVVKNEEFGKLMSEQQHQIESYKGKYAEALAQIASHKKNQDNFSAPPVLKQLQSLKDSQWEVMNSPSQSQNQNLLETQLNQQQIQQLKSQLQFIKQAYEQTLQENSEFLKKIRELEIEKQKIYQQLEQKQMENMNAELDLHIKIQEQEDNMKKSINASNRSNRQANNHPPLNHQTELIEAVQILKQLINNNNLKNPRNTTVEIQEARNRQLFSILNSPCQQGNYQNSKTQIPQKLQANLEVLSQEYIYMLVSRILLLEQQLNEQESTISLEAIRAKMIEKSRMVSMQLSKSKTDVMRMKVQHNERLMLLQLLKPIDISIKQLIETSENLGNEELANIIQHYSQNQNIVQ